MRLERVVRSFPDFPRPGVLFRDISPILKDPVVFRKIIRQLQEASDEEKIDLVAGIESRGFIFGIALAQALGKGFVPVRKAGKLPGETIRTSYTIEYGEATIEMQRDAVKPGDRVLLVDDLLATGGTAQAATSLIERLGGRVVGIAFVIELSSLKGREKLGGHKVHSLLKFD